MKPSDINIQYAAYIDCVNRAHVILMALLYVGVACWLYSKYPDSSFGVALAASFCLNIVLLPIFSVLLGAICNLGWALYEHLALRRILKK